MKPGVPYQNRSEAGQLLGGELVEDYQARLDTLILGIANGGVPVAAEVAAALRAPFDALAIGTIASPNPPGLTIGAVAPGSILILDQDLIRALGLPGEEVDRLAMRSRQELERRQRLYLGSRPEPDLKNRTVILVDDAACTGWSMLAAIRFARQQKPKQVVLALPVASSIALERFRHQADACVCLAVPETCLSITDWYWKLPAVTDDEVRQLIAKDPQEKA